MTPAGSGAVSEAVSRVEAELNAFWSAASVGDEPKARASTMNFVVIGGTAATDHLRDEIETLSHTRAGRAFLMTIDGHLAPWEVTSDVSAVCHKEGDTVVCYDRIELGFGAIAAQRAASVLGALVLPEVPTIVEAGAGAPISPATRRRRSPIAPSAAPSRGATWWRGSSTTSSGRRRP